MKIRKSIFTKLIGSFILYAVATVLTFILCLLLSVVFIGEGDLNRVRPDNVIDENGNVINLDIAQKIGGWVEELDSSYNVINIYGEKDLSAPAETKLGGAAALTFDYTATVNGIPYKYRQIVSAYKDIFYVFTYTSTVDCFDAHLTDVDSIVAYFTFK